jgi:hypothetical protein
LADVDAASGDDDARAAYLGADFTYTRTPGGWRIRSVTIEPGMRLPAN